MLARRKCDKGAASGVVGGVGVGKLELEVLVGNFSPIALGDPPVTLLYLLLPFPEARNVKKLFSGSGLYFSVR